MLATAIIVAGLAVIGLTIAVLRMVGLAQDLATSEADRDRLELQLRELVEDDTATATTHKLRLKAILAEQEVCREEVHRRREPGDALIRLRMLSEAPSETPGDHNQG